MRGIFHHDIPVDPKVAIRNKGGANIMDEVVVRDSFGGDILTARYAEETNHEEEDIALR